jgi:hypothetical protein
MYNYQECYCTTSGCILWFKQEFCRDCSWSDGAGTICGAWYQEGAGCNC